MSDKIYAQRGTNEKVTINAVHRNSNGSTVYFTDRSGVTKHTGLNAFNKKYYYVSGGKI